MKYFRNTTDVLIEEDTVLSLGKFDGLHAGHQCLIEQLLQQKRMRGIKSAIFTFVSPPSDAIDNTKHKVLLTLDEKEYIFEKAGIDYLIEYPFSQDIMRITAEEFIEKIVKSLHVKAFIVGTDYRFGYQRKGDYHLLESYAKEYGYEVIVVEKKKLYGQDISSTRIRTSIEDDQLSFANELLDYPYFIQGTVTEGKQIGRTIGIPTINLVPPDEKLLPSFGVYVSKVEIGNKIYPGLTNIGRKPTVGNKLPIGVETHILGFNQMIYGSKVRVHLIKKIREEKKFASVEELKAQIQKDLEVTRDKYYKYITKS